MKLINFLIAIIVISCLAGIAIAEDDTTDTEDTTTTDIQLYTAEDTETVLDAIANSGAGIIFAAINIIFTMSLSIVPALIILGIILASMLNNADTHKWLIRALLVIIVAVIALRMYSVVIVSFTPDLSVIKV